MKIKNRLLDTIDDLYDGLGRVRAERDAMEKALITIMKRVMHIHELREDAESGEIKPMKDYFWDNGIFSEIDPRVAAYIFRKIVKSVTPVDWKDFEEHEEEDEYVD